MGQPSAENNLLYQGVASETGVVWTPPAGTVLWCYGNNTETGGEWTDQSGTGNHVDPLNGATIGSNGLVLSDAVSTSTGNHNAGDSGTDSSLDITGNITWSAWINLTASPSGSLGYVMAKRDGSNAQYGFGVRDVSGSKHVWAGGGSFDLADYSTTSFSTGVFTHIAASVSSGTATFYVNGSAAGTAAISGLSSKPTISVCCGARWSGYPQTTFNIQGTLDDILINNTALTATQILDIYNNSPGTHK